ncbi:hypothetical protein SAMN05444007_106129 [Cribrihabitans marinus]|uniref:DUF1178 family protein n=1 Tax=Cribrihabitans marinus TaxID=1227549 RepID=A0A1H7AQ16_9RHOB|nr:DUF1178 family protein [Cribrihabitans marinus]GGH32300.1 hypothetical protein GCM10010973_23660 [Cribrihabitans marinus]SEJ67659.1 hypothetical protein SAMN05444007_106129 [Cribrihabitans marinus]
MIQYALKCREGHCFDSWFQSAEAFDKLAASGLVSCAVCGGSDVHKAVMTPRVSAGRDADPAPAKPAPRLTEPVNRAEKAVAELRRKIEQNADFVGRDFAKEARAMHLGDAPERSIYGEARADEAKALRDDGVPVVMLPFIPNRKSN